MPVKNPLTVPPTFRHEYTSSAISVSASRSQTMRRRSLAARGGSGGTTGPLAYPVDSG